MNNSILVIGTEGHHTHGLPPRLQPGDLIEADTGEGGEAELFRVWQEFQWRDYSDMRRQVRSEREVQYAEKFTTHVRYRLNIPLLLASGLVQRVRPIASLARDGSVRATDLSRP